VQFTAPFAGAGCCGKQVSATKKQNNTMKLPSVFVVSLGYLLNVCILPQVFRFDGEGLCMKLSSQSD